MLEYLIIFILGGLPISEIRGAIIYGLSQNLNIGAVFLFGALGNIIAIPIIFFALEKLNLIKLAKKLFGKTAYKKIEKNKPLLDKWGELALLIFIALPLPITGAWMGSLIATLLKMDKKKSFAVIIIGILIAGLITLGVTQGAITGFSMLTR
jgi:uncharacterized membrane protein